MQMASTHSVRSPCVGRRLFNAHLEIPRDVLAPPVAADWCEELFPRASVVRKRFTLQIGVTEIDRFHLALDHLHIASPPGAARCWYTYPPRTGWAS